jgi:hypothetical protein
MLSEFGLDYVTRRGIDSTFALANGIDETVPDPELIRSRFNFNYGPDQVRKAFAEVKSLLWFPLFRADGFVNYVARVNGIYRNQEGEEVRFLFTKSGRRAPWIPLATLDVAKQAEKPIIFTESFFKALTVLHAGGLAVGFNGPWINEKTAPEEKDKSNNRVLVAELGGFRWMTRKVYFAFDLDQTTNPQVRHAVIRGWILLKIAGAHIYQLEWDKQDKGIDDHLARVCGLDQARQKEVLDELCAAAKPFADVLLKGSGGDARLVREELRKVKMDITDREAFAKEVASRLGVTKASLLSTEGSKKTASSRQVIFHDLEPCEQPVDGNALLAELVALIHKHILINNDDALTIAPWIIWTYLADEDYVEVSPYLGITSPDKRCAKTRCLDLIERLVKRGYGISDITKSSFFRFVEQWHPTLCLDEFHKLIKNRPDLLQPFLNAYSRNKPVLVTNTETMEPEVFDIWGARALAYLEELDDQFRDRVIEINLERKPRGVTKPKLRETPLAYTEELRRKLLRWALDNAEAVGKAIVPVFETDNDRAADNWEMLFKIIATIDPDNVAAVVQIAHTKETSIMAERESEQEAALKAIRKVYEDACEHIGKAFSDPATDVFISLDTICSIMNRDKEGVWQAWHFGEQRGAYERKIAQILRSYTKEKPQRSRAEPDLAELIGGFRDRTTDVRGYWLSTLRTTFGRYH